MSLAVLEREQGGMDGGGGRRERGRWDIVVEGDGGVEEEEELCFRDHRHLYYSLICDGVRKEVRHGHGAPQGLWQDCGRGSAIKETAL